MHGRKCNQWNSAHVLGLCCQMHKTLEPLFVKRNTMNTTIQDHVAESVYQSFKVRRHLNILNSILFCDYMVELGSVRHGVAY